MLCMTELMEVLANNKILNKAAGSSLNFLGGSAIMWNMKHNIIHHTYTNIDGIDDDIEASPWLRFASTQKKLKMHKFQQYYFWFLYALLHIVWIFISDYQKYFKRKIGVVQLRKMTPYEHFSFWAAKLIYTFMFVSFTYNPFGLYNLACWLFNYYNGYRICYQYGISIGTYS